MTHYLRFVDEQRFGDTVVDIEATKDDIHCVVCIEAYSRLLLSIKPVDVDRFIKDFDDTQEIRGAWFEFNQCKTPTDVFAAGWLKPLAEKWNLVYLTD